MNVGFIGLGTMGKPMAGNLITGGHRLFLHDLGPLPQDLLDAGAQGCTSGRAVAEAAEIVILMVPDTPDVEAALFAAGGVVEGLTPGQLVIDMSSISPTATARFAARVAELDCDYLDAPVSGGNVRAEDGTLTIMVGGPQTALTRARPLFELMGATITHIGARNGDGQVAKAANQIVVGLTIEAVAEALTFAAKTGADPAKVRAALLGGAAASPILENHGKRMLERDFTALFRADLQQKDLNVALSAARELGIVLPATAATEQLYNALRARGGITDDHTAIIQVIEDLAGGRD